jgi:hypothetical protein
LVRSKGESVPQPEFDFVRRTVHQRFEQRPQRTAATQDAVNELGGETAVGGGEWVRDELTIEDFLDEGIVLAAVEKDLQGQTAGVVLRSPERRHRSLHGVSGPK